MSKLQELGFSGPYQFLEDGSVHGSFNGHPYHIHPTTHEAWAALSYDIANSKIEIQPYQKPAEIKPDPQVEIKRQIVTLERQITPRRLREALLGVDESVKWVAEKDEQIKELRKLLG
jgi:hypothetical protein